MATDNEEKEVSFRDRSIKGKIASIAGITLLIVLVIVFVFGFYFFGLAGIFELLGVQYESIWSLVIFIVGVLILSFFVELFSKAIYILLALKISGKIQRLLTRGSIETVSNWFVLFTVDEFMNSITISFQAEIIIALLIAVTEIAFDGDEDKEKTEKNY